MPQQSDELRLLRHIADLRFEEELRGYSKSQVDRVLQKLTPLADDFEELHRKLAQAETRAASAEARLLERGGNERDVASTPAVAVVESTPAAEPVVAAAPSTVAPSTVPETPADFDETLRKTLLLAQRTADETVKEAYDEADRITNNAHSEADLVLGKARNEAEQVTTDTEQRRVELQTELDDERHNQLLHIETETETRRVQLETALADAEGSERTELLEQIANLQQVRTTLAKDIEVLEGHLAARRETIQSALDDVATVLEEPGRLRSDGSPNLTDVAVVDAGDYSDVGIDVEAHITEPPEELDDGEEERDDEISSIEVVGEMQTDDGQVDVVVERHDEDELPELPQRRKPAATDNGPGAAAGSTAATETDSLESATGETFSNDSGSSDPVSSDPAPNDYEEGDTESSIPSELESDTVSISEAIPSIDSGPAPDAAGPPTQEFSFADVDVPDDGDPEEASSEIARPTSPVAEPAPVPSSEVQYQADAPDEGGERPAWMDSVPDAVSDGPPPPPPATGNSQDPFLDQLRKATSEEVPDSDEALDKFLEGDEDDSERRPWFGRRR